MFPIAHQNGLSMVQDDPKLLEDSGEVPRPNGVVGGSIPGHEVSSLLDGKTSQVAMCLLCSQLFLKRKNGLSSFVLPSLSNCIDDDIGV